MSTITIDCEEYLRLKYGTASDGGVSSGGEVNTSSSNSPTLESGNYTTNKPFLEWARWSHSWEGTSTYGITGGKNPNGLIKDVTAEKADKYAMENFWQPNNIDLVTDSSVAIACMFCVFWTGNAHLLYQVMENPDVYGGRPQKLPNGHYRINQELINYFNRSNALKIFNKIKKQLGWFGQISQAEKYRNGHRRRWYSVNFHQKLILNNEANYNVPNQEQFLKMIEKL